MAEFFEMPQASPTMETGTLLRWKKGEGEVLKPTDVIAEVETDKAAMDIEVFDAGVLLKILAAEGEEVPAGRPIAIVGQSGDDIGPLLARFERIKASGGGAGAKPQEAPESATRTETSAPTAEGLQPFTWHGKAVDPAIMEMPVAFGGGWSPAAALPARESAFRPTPAGRRRARQQGLEAPAAPSGAPAVPVPSPPRPRRPQPSGPGERIPNTRMRTIIAERLTSAAFDAPVFFLTAVFECDALVAMRAADKKRGLQYSSNDMLIRASALALREVPGVNAAWDGDAIHRHSEVHVGMAVALEEGLITPVVRHADTKGLAVLATETRDLVDRARRRKLEPGEYTGGTFTLSNLGMMGIEHFTAILNPPEACILAVGTLKQEPVARDGQLALGWRMRATLTCDHRVVDGALGARFLGALRDKIENPQRLATDNG